jgi:hypothetical protein
VLDLARELCGIVAALDGAGATYALAGGLAVSIYPTPRATQDIDFLSLKRLRGSAQDRADLEALGGETA